MRIACPRIEPPARRTLPEVRRTYARTRPRAGSIPHRHRPVPTRRCGQRLARCQIRLSHTGALACARPNAAARAAPPGLGRADNRSTRVACALRAIGAPGRPPKRSRLTPLPFMMHRPTSAQRTRRARRRTRRSLSRPACAGTRGCRTYRRPFPATPARAMPPFHANCATRPAYRMHRSRPCSRATTAAYSRAA